MNTEIIKQLRQTSGAGIQDCQKALKEAGGALDKALEILRKKSQKIATKKQSRATSQGVIDAYIHSTRLIGTLVELTCETDFVARNEEFKNLAHDIAMQVAATDPQWIGPSDVPGEMIEKEKKLCRETIPKDKPRKVKEKIIKGKLEKFYQEVCLLKQLFIKDDKITIEKLIETHITKLGENIKVKNFVRFSL